MANRTEIKEMLTSCGAEQQTLFDKAASLRNQFFGKTVILRGVIEVTNICRVDCNYCPMRRTNTKNNYSFFASVEDILLSAQAVKRSGINVILLQGGETLGIIKTIEAAIPKILDLYDGKVEILLNLGCFSRSVYKRLKKLGAISYILKHETSDSILHKKIRHEALDQRLGSLLDLSELGFKTGTGLISSLPKQTLESIIDDIELVEKFEVDMCSVSPFIPAKNTPMSGYPQGDINLALNIVACLRVLYPKILIPSVSAFEKIAKGGQKKGLEAGGNVLTINFSPAHVKKDYLIYGNERYVVNRNHVLSTLNQLGLSPRGSIFLDPNEIEQYRSMLPTG